MKLPGDKTLKKYFRKNHLWFTVDCDTQCRFEDNTKQKVGHTEKITENQSLLITL